jgi:hypothetical protein
MSEDDTDRINAGLDAIEASLQRMTAEIEAFWQEALAKLDAIIATCDRILDDMRRQRGAWIRGVDAPALPRSGFSRCGHSSGVPTPTCG